MEIINNELDFECQKELTKLGYGTHEQLWQRYSGEIDKEAMVNNIKPTYNLYKQLFRLWEIEWKPSNVKKHKKFIEYSTNEFIYKNLASEIIKKQIENGRK